MVPMRSQAVPGQPERASPERPSRSRGRSRTAIRRRAARFTFLVLGLLALATGCSWMGMSDRELERELEAARQKVAEDPQASLTRLERVAWRRQDSIAARELLVEACLTVDTIETRRL